MISEQNDEIFFKYILIGETGGGKSHILQSYIDYEYTDCFKVTIGVD